MELTVSEKAVLYSSARGRTIPQTAEELLRSEEGMKYIRKRLIHKLEAKNITHAVAIAIRKGLIIP